jgi:hypothetical protein
MKKLRTSIAQALLIVLFAAAFTAFTGCSAIQNQLQGGEEEGYPGDAETGFSEKDNPGDTVRAAEEILAAYLEVDFEYLRTEVSESDRGKQFNRYIFEADGAEFYYDSCRWSGRASATPLCSFPKIYDDVHRDEITQILGTSLLEYDEECHEYVVDMNDRTVFEKVVRAVNSFTYPSKPNVFGNADAGRDDEETSFYWQDYAAIRFHDSTNYDTDETRYDDEYFDCTIYFRFEESMPLTEGILKTWIEDGPEGMEIGDLQEFNQKYPYLRWGNYYL